MLIHRGLSGKAAQSDCHDALSDEQSSDIFGV